MPDKKLPTTPSSEQVDNSYISRFVNAISARIMMITVWVIVLLVIIMAMQLYWFNSDLNLQAMDSLNNLDDKTQTLDIQNLLSRSYLEYDAQELRTKRSQWLVSAKLFTHGLAIMSGILMITMGSAFIFARIRSGESRLEASLGQKSIDQEIQDPEALTMMAKERAKLVLSSYSPGVFFAFFGTTIIIVALLTSVNSRIFTTDEPVFLPNYNPTKHQNSDKVLLDADGKYDPSKKCEALGHIHPDFCDGTPPGEEKR